ncbi:ABC transporter permease subunit [Dongia rigui]|uniref:ABC transporter permease subunit n=1 Tax=Dongia rigui TaxID=940149 RepID=A0ABU5E157_9PROT|nr:ABC transporter permease subunit [Dongia rigui]MDY0873037.1 ABC transporter permease subunit [Dongia rigui]
MTNRLSWFVIAALVFGFIFLYGPMVVLVTYSFNANKLMTLWGGFSTKWYPVLLNDAAVLTAAKNSLIVAAVSATFATVLGTMAGYVLARYRKFHGRTAFSGMVTAPLVMPEVITGLSMLLLFKEMGYWFGWPKAMGFSTVILAHITFSMSYVTVVMQSRFSVFDMSLEEAALDLGAKPLKTFMLITLPIVAPAVVSGWLLAFTISLDDLVITIYNNGPGSGTLPQLIFSKVRRGVDPTINALATIIITVVATGVIASHVLMTRQEKRRQRDIQAALQANN